MPTRFDDQQISQALQELNGSSTHNIWAIQDGKLCKTFVFNDFVNAFSWMTQAAIWSEKLNHHPEWFNVYKTVEVKLVTHDVDGISELDFELAAKMDLCATSFKRK